MTRTITPHREPSYDTEPTYGMRNALRAVLLFYAGGPWTQDRRDEWRRLTGSTEASTKVLCDHARSALAIGAAGSADEHQHLYGLTAGHVLTERDVEHIQNLLADNNDQIGATTDALHNGRMQAFFEIGGQKLVDEKMAADEAMVDAAVQRALDRWRDMQGTR